MWPLDWRGSLIRNVRAELCQSRADSDAHPDVPNVSQVLTTLMMADNVGHDANPLIIREAGAICRYAQMKAG